MPTVSEFRAGMAQFIDAVQHDGDRVVVTSHGRPAFAVVSIDDYEWLEELERAEEAADAEAFDDAVHDGTMSDAELGAFLAAPVEQALVDGDPIVQAVMAAVEDVLSKHFSKR